jgi:hypothetical protein
MHQNLMAFPVPSSGKFTVINISKSVKDCKTLALTPNQGDQIGRIFNIWLLFTWVLLKFYPNRQFQNTVCLTYFNIQKHFDATIFNFQFELL